MAQDEEEKAKRERADSLRRTIASLRTGGSGRPPRTPRELTEHGAREAREREEGPAEREKSDGTVEEGDPSSSTKGEDRE
jgi:hypothetical protein